MFVGLCLSSPATVLLSGLDAPQAPAPTGALAAPYGGLNGIVNSWVAGDAANPLGGLSFYYQIHNKQVQSVTALISQDFGIVPGAPAQVSTITSDSSDPGATTRDRSNGDGSVQFSLIGAPRSQVLVVNTSFQTFDGIVNLDFFSPGAPAVGPVPEPATFMTGILLLVPFAAGAMRMVRKR